MTSTADRLSTMASSVLGGELPIRIRAWDGSMSGRAGGPVLVINNRRALRRLVYSPGELGLAEAYVSGDVDVEGDLAEGLSTVWAANRSGRLARTVDRPSARSPSTSTSPLTYASARPSSPGE